MEGFLAGQKPKHMYHEKTEYKQVVASDCSSHIETSAPPVARPLVDTDFYGYDALLDNFSLLSKIVQ